MVGDPPDPAAVVLALLLFWFIRSVVRGRRPVGSVGFFLGLAGVLIVALGVHLTIGGFVGEVAGDFGPQIRETCSTGVFCTVGLQSGFTGLWAGSWRSSSASSRSARVS